MTVRWLRSTSAVVLGIMMLGGCVSGPDYRPPAQPSGTAGPFIAARGPAVQPSAPVPSAWWKLYGDPVLDRLIDDALAANTDIRSAAARVEQARAALREVEVDRLPHGGVEATSVRQRALGASTSYTALRANLSVGYEIDLFGRIRRGVAAARSDVAAAEADAEAARILVIAETVRAYADAASASERAESAEQILTLLDRSLYLTRRRVEIGETARIDSARIAALRNMRAADIPAIAANGDAALFRLALLTGRPPGALPVTTRARTNALILAQPIPVGDGAQLLARRPDVRAAERRLAAATTRIGVATAELYPTINLAGTAEAAGHSVGTMLGNPISWLLGPLVSMSFGEHFRARARVLGAEASTRLALAQFDGTMLRAVQETETALSAYLNALARREALQSALDEAAVVARIVRVQQREGQVDSLELLDAERTYADAQAELIEMNGKVANAQIDLFLALGGGWGAKAGLEDPKPRDGLGRRAGRR